MANIKSAKKRIHITKRKQVENRIIKSSMNTAVKKFYAAVNSNDVTKAEELLPITVSIVDSAASKGVIHKNTASNKNGQMTRVLMLLKEGKLNIVEPAKKGVSKKAKSVEAVEPAPVVEEKPKKAVKKVKAEEAAVIAEAPKKVKKTAKSEDAPKAAEAKKTKKKAE